MCSVKKGLCFSTPCQNTTARALRNLCSITKQNHSVWLPLLIVLQEVVVHSNNLFFVHAITQNLIIHGRCFSIWTLCLACGSVLICSLMLYSPYRQLELRLLFMLLLTWSFLCAGACRLMSLHSVSECESTQRRFSRPRPCSRTAGSIWAVKCHANR